ncbi:Uncharacterized protein APZ42_028762 [Daphnia magna]|uniref:Uncharacterized protein n=1 Tax=Daphnia magna TaxID=35525 RepID=A0A164QCW6_9CRUS|nr:Uncharacterized protein APZ42_028762 [Daphnia magna]
MRKELKRQLEEKDNQLRMAEQQEEENENTQKELTALLIQTTNELNRTRNILRRQQAREAMANEQKNHEGVLNNISTVQAVLPNDPAMMTESTASNTEVHMSEEAQTEDILVLDVPERESTVFTIEFEERNQEFVDTDYIKPSVADLIRGFEKRNQEFVDTDSVADLITKAVNEPAIEMNVQSETDGTKGIASRPVKRVTFATKVEEIPRKSSKVSRFIERVDAQLVKQGFLRESYANITASIQVKMNEQPVEMVIDGGCFESIISQDQWRQLGEPELKPLTKDDLITLKRTGKYKKRVTLEQIGGYFHAIVKLQEKVMVLPVYVCAKDKIMPNFLGRRLFHDLHLQKEKAYLVQFTRTNETGSLLTTGSTTQPESEETDKMENPVTEQETQTDLTEALTTLLRVLNEKSKEKDQKKREKYEKWMCELIEYNIELKKREMAELVDTMPSRTKSEPNVPAKDYNYAKTEKAITTLQHIYRQQHKRFNKIIREVEKMISAFKDELDSTVLESKRIILTDAIQQRQKALEAVVEEERCEFAEKMSVMTEAKNEFLKPPKEIKIKTFSKELKTAWTKTQKLASF